jgi:hypothetical protein
MHMVHMFTPGHCTAGMATGHNPLRASCLRLTRSPSDCHRQTDLIFRKETGNALLRTNVWEAPLPSHSAFALPSRQGCDVWRCQPMLLSLCT